MWGGTPKSFVEKNSWGFPNHERWCAIGIYRQEVKKRRGGGPHVSALSKKQREGAVKLFSTESIEEDQIPDGLTHRPEERKTKTKR